jgi:diaminohydroxyphosphoribosylaminopyrimidine deaminase/5-amino-6-(5-phosphoribosylamino)uracil reductase
MHRCFQLAKQGESYVAPNPMVGAVLVYNDSIIGEGFHAKYGEAHAEVNCINSVKDEDKELISKSTLYVSLEPCAHFGKTPPCADLIIQHKIPKVVIAVQDNFDAVNGKGIQRLKENNVAVITGILEDEGKELIKHFLYFHQNKKPFVTLKFAQTKDGFLGIKNEEIKISNDLSKRYVHQLRAEHQAILVGKTTVITDNPKLNVRHWQGKNPIRIVLGNENEIPKEYSIFNDESETLFLSTVDGRLSTVDSILNQLYQKNIISVLVEGGANVIQQFINANAWNETVVISSDEKMSRESLVVSHEQFVKAPIFTGSLTHEFQLENNLIQLFKNTHDLSFI